MMYLRLWRRLLVATFVRESAYRASFAVSVLQGLIEVVLAVLTFALLYQFTDSIAGWTSAEVLVLVGLYRVVDGLVNAHIAPNMQALTGYVRSGELDLLLLRPVQSQFLVSTRIVVLPELVNVAIGLALVALAGVKAGVSWDGLAVVEALAFVACGLALIYATWFALATLALWLYDNSLNELFYSILGAGRYPVQFFSGPVRVLLTFVVPVAFAITFPAEALLGRGNPALLALGIGLAGALLLGSHGLWTYALRRYSSASS